MACCVVSAQAAALPLRAILTRFGDGSKSLGWKSQWLKATKNLIITIFQPKNNIFRNQTLTSPFCVKAYGWMRAVPFASSSQALAFARHSVDIIGLALKSSFDAPNAVGSASLSRCENSCLSCSDCLKDCVIDNLRNFHDKKSQLWKWLEAGINGLFIV